MVCGRRPDSPVDDRVGARTTQAWPSPSARGAGQRTQRRSQVLASSPPWRSPPPPTGLAGCHLTGTPVVDPLYTAVNAALVTLAASRSSRGPLLHPCRRCGRPEPKLAAGAQGRRPGRGVRIGHPTTRPATSGRAHRGPIGSGRFALALRRIPRSHCADRGRHRARPALFRP